MDKVTVYTRSTLLGNIVKTEARLVSHGLVRYAQYENAVEVILRPKRARKNRRYCEGYNPFVLILEGWGHVDPDGIYPEAKKDERAVRGRYGSFSAGWVNDFNGMMNEYIESGKGRVVADYRGEIKTA